MQSGTFGQSMVTSQQTSRDETVPATQRTQYVYVFVAPGSHSTVSEKDVAVPGRVAITTPSRTISTLSHGQTVLHWRSTLVPEVLQTRLPGTGPQGCGVLTASVISPRGVAPGTSQSPFLKRRTLSPTSSRKLQPKGGMASIAQHSVAGLQFLNTMPMTSISTKTSKQLCAGKQGPPGCLWQMIPRLGFSGQSRTLMGPQTGSSPLRSSLTMRVVTQQRPSLSL